MSARPTTKKNVQHCPYTLKIRWEAPKRPQSSASLEMELAMKYLGYSNLHFFGKLGAGDVKQAVETFDELCNHVEHALGVKIPKYLKNILMWGGFDNRVALRSLEESDVSSLETLVKSDAFCNCSRYPGSGSYSYLYASYPDDFTIVPGHRRLLIAIAAYLRENPKIVKTSHE